VASVPRVVPAVAACCAALLGSASGASTATARGGELDVTLEDFSGPSRAWRLGPGLALERKAVDGDAALAIRRVPPRSGAASSRAPAGGGWSGSLARGLPAGGAVAISVDLGLSTGGQARLFGGDGSGPPLELRRTATALVVSAGDRRWVLRTRADGRRFGHMHHIEAVAGAGLRLSIDGVAIDPPIRPGRSFAISVRRGRVLLDSFVASRLADRRALLLHRLAAIHASTPRGRAPLGVGSDGTTRYFAGWTRGFWPGALWQAADLTPSSHLFMDWALDATMLNFGRERSDTHDLGFMYGRSSVAAFERRCDAVVEISECAQLRASGLEAADALAALAATNSVAGMIPTRSETLCRGCAGFDEADTIIDSMMNLSLLLWAARESPERAGYRDIALRHADGVARYLVRPDGSTAQSVHTHRADGSVIAVHTHQGVSDTSTWARGQAWALYGFAETSLLTRSRPLLDVAERTAYYVEARAFESLVPPYDYAAGPGAPTDTSAGVISAAGLFRLEDACRSLRRCEDRGRRWGDLGERMLDASLASVRARPLGLFDGQVFSFGGITPWDDRGEFVFGLDYGLEAIARATGRR
jgi:unsaturated chondroitin disaccharide hydrolase